MSFIKKMWICQVNERPYEPGTGLQEEQERGFWRKVWEFIKALFAMVD